MIDLKNCAHCGGYARMLESVESDPPYSYTALYVKCSNCGIQTAKKPNGGYMAIKYTPEQVAEIWNRRIRG